MTATPIILDVDTGVDDALALALAVAHPAVELVAVTTVAGNVDVSRTTDNTLRVLSYLDAADVPVHRGASRPLLRPHVDAASVHGTNGLGNAQLPDPTQAIGRDRGPAAMVRLARERPGELTLVCVGPLTNVAIALNVEPSLPMLLRNLVVMGGAFRVPGNVEPWAEFNIFVDPEAAQQVFAAPFASITAIGLDVSHQVALPRDAWRRAASASSPSASLIDRVCERTFLERANTQMYLHDPLALAVAIDPTLVGTETGRVIVSTEAAEPGRTTFHPGDGRTRLATTVESARFVGEFVDLVLGPNPA